MFLSQVKTLKGPEQLEAMRGLDSRYCTVLPAGRLLNLRFYVIYMAVSLYNPDTGLGKEGEKNTLCYNLGLWKGGFIRTSSMICSTTRARA